MKTIRSIFASLLLVLLTVPAMAQLSSEERAAGEQAAKDIIDRFTGGKVSVSVELSLTPDSKGCDSYSYASDGSTVTIKASSAVAACRAFYDYAKSKGAGISSWSGVRFAVPDDLAAKEVTLTSQYRHHQYMNVVTYGYTAAYWDEERWDREIDWMALHGIDMPLMLIGAEQVYREVFYEMGLTKADVDAWEVGPAHLPWFRMGNLCGNSFDGPLGEEWNAKQEALCKHVLARMRALGMKPICPAFGGFVPKAFASRVKGATTESVGWNWCINSGYGNYRLSPTSEMFAKVGTAFIQKWEEKYGKCQYYLSDSFNEMAIPSASALPAYGRNIWKSIHDANPDAVWVTQGWTFVYQQGDWGLDKFKALTSEVPDEQFMVLHMSAEYPAGDYNNKRWENYNGYNGKQWVYTLLPNMGGKTNFVGKVSDYAGGFLTKLYGSTKKGNLTGYGMTPEGVENNEIIYELITDAGWVPTNGTINLDQWFQQYADCRYGSYSANEKAYHNALRKSVYNYFTDHPRFGWQVGSNLTGGGSASQNDEFYTGVETLFSDVEALRRQCADAPLLQADLAEAAAFYCGGKIEKVNARINAALNAGQGVVADSLIEKLDRLMLDMDRVLTVHPVYNLAPWEERAQRLADSDTYKKRNAVNARRIVTVWFGNHTYDEPVQDYAARVWAGLVRDYYRPRLMNQWKQQRGQTGFPNGRAKWEEQWVETAPFLSDYEPVPADTIGFIAAVVEEARTIIETKVEKLDKFEVSNGHDNHWYALRAAYDVNSDKVLTADGNNNRLGLDYLVPAANQMWRFVKTGSNTYRLENRLGQCIAVNSTTPWTYGAPIYSDVKMEKAADGSCWWAILPTAAASSSPAIHFNGSMMLYGYKSGSNYYAGSHWTIENVAAALVPEASTDDYTRYLRRLQGYTQTDLFGQVGQPRSAEALQQAIDQLTAEAQNIDHKTFDTFLDQWATLWESLIVTADNQDVKNLIELIGISHEYLAGEAGGGDYEVRLVNTSAIKVLQSAINKAETAAAAGNLTSTTAKTQIKTLSTAIQKFLSSTGNTIVGPEPSTEQVQYGYRMFTPNRENRYLFSQGAGKILLGVQAEHAHDDTTIWDFYQRTDGTLDIRNRADGCYITPTASNNTSLTTVKKAPTKGWTIKTSNADGCFLLTSGTTVMVNQTGFEEGIGKKVYNWGAASGQNGAGDTGCQYAITFVGMKIAEAVKTMAMEPASTATYDLQGRQVPSPTQGLFIQNGKKIFLR